MLSLVTNTASLTAQRNLDATNDKLNNSLEKLSSGLRVNRASDDVAAMAVGSRLGAELEALKTVQTNAGQATSLLQIAEGSMGRTNDILTRMKSLAAQASNDTLSDTERELLDVEFQALVDEVNRLAADTTFNGSTLVNSEQSVTIDNSNFADDIRVAGPVAETGGATDVFVDADGSGGGAAITDASTDAIFTFNDGTNTFSGTLSTDNITASGTVDGDQTVTLTSSGTSSSVVVFLADGADLDANSQVAGTIDTNGGGTGTNDFDFRIGTGAVASEDVISAAINAVNATALGIDDGQSGNGGGLDITDKQSADRASATIDAAINALVESRAKVGSSQNRIETARTNLATTIENTEAAKSALLDADISSEITEFTSKQILLQSGISTLAQANQVPQNLLSLFQ